jgi:Mor family transcriptional regulator
MNPPMTTSKPVDLPPLDIINQEAQHVAMRFGIACGSDMAAALVSRIIACLGGTTIYIPSATAYNAKSRNSQICDDFDGRNYAELARKNGLSEKQIRNIIASGKSVN